MDLSTLIALAAVLFPILGGILTWLWKHSTRLTGAEIRIEGLTANAEADRRDIRATLMRIEDKLDRKQDRA